MTILLENPIPIYFVGAVLATLCGLTFLVRRSLRSLLALVGVVAVTVLLVMVERAVVTNREQIEEGVFGLIEVIEKNELPSVLARIDPAAAEVLSDAKTLMQLVKVEDTGASMLHVEFESDGEPQSAFSRFLGKIDGVHKPTGQRVFYFDEVQLFWVKRQGQWLVESYRIQSNGTSVDAVDRVRTLDR